MSDTPKSAYELALEKLKQRDRERGEAAPALLTNEQKRKIAEIRRMCEAKLAEREILHASERARVLSEPESQEKLPKLEEDYLRDRRRIEEERDRKVEAVRAGKAARGRGGRQLKALLAALGLGLLAASARAAPVAAPAASGATSRHQMCRPAPPRGSLRAAIPSG